MQTKLRAPASAFIRNGDIVIVKFVDKKATSDKDIYVLDSKGTAATVNVSRFEKGNSFHSE